MRFCCNCWLGDIFIVVLLVSKSNTVSLVGKSCRTGFVFRWSGVCHHRRNCDNRLEGVVFGRYFFLVVVVVSTISEVLGLSVILSLSSELEILLHQGLMSLQMC